MYASVMALQFGELTLSDILTDIPLDVGAFLVLLCVGGLMFLVWLGSRRDVIERYGAGRIRPPALPEPKSVVENPDPPPDSITHPVRVRP